MKIIKALSIVCIAMDLATYGAGAIAYDQDPSMGFFVTSVGMGDGANLGGLNGEYAHCQKLVEAAGVEPAR